jgi:hypothetical protein
MLTRISGVVNEIVISQKNPKYCYLIFNKKRHGKTHQIAVTCFCDQIQKLGIKPRSTVYTKCIIKSTIMFGKVYTDIMAEKLSLAEFEDNPFYVKKKREVNDGITQSEEFLFDENEEE